MDYYKILGVNKDADKNTIKKAYRKMAMKYHPDRNKDDKKAEEMFKKVNEAYAVLSDPEKKQQYDTYGSTDFHQRFSQEDIFRGSDINSILREFGINLGGNARMGGMGGGFSGGNPFDMFSRSCGGGSCSGGGFSQQPAKGQDLSLELPVTLEEVLNGSKKTISLGRGGEKVSVKIPAGIESGRKLRVSGKGSPSPMGGPAGDLYLMVSLQPHDTFMREQNNLIINNEIPFSQAVLGSKISVPTLDGKSLNVKIPAGIQAGGKLRLKGHGLPTQGKKTRGDLYVKIMVRVPKKISAEQKKIIKLLQESGL